LCACQARGKALTEDHDRPVERPFLKILHKAGSWYNEQIDAACAAARVLATENTAQYAAGEAVERCQNACLSAGISCSDGANSEFRLDGFRIGTEAHQLTFRCCPAQKKQYGFQAAVVS